MGSFLGNDECSVRGYVLLLSLLQAPSTDYQEYHQEIRKAEEHLAESAYHQALDKYEAVFADYDFIFVRDLKIATQVAWYLRDTSLAIEFLERGISAGWQRKDIRRNECLDALRQTNAYRELDKRFPDLRKQYEQAIDQTLRKQVHQLFKQDQWKALGPFCVLAVKLRTDMQSAASRPKVKNT
jgi:hypothetical protein